ncbi:MAG: DNA-processing protein DprA [Patescibacteria group bacterium]|nr:DNA-processing protein DprA [Patescibacteria group bacterium]
MLKLTGSLLPERILHIPQPPKQLYVMGADISILLQHSAVAIVGSRSITPYGRQVTTLFARQLAEKGVVIISGLALGVDACAHQAALDVGGKTIAVLPSPLDNIVPSTNRKLAAAILASGGALVSEYEPGSESFKGNFVERNRLMSGLADAILVPEAARRSGTLHTVDFALDQGREVLTVPGSIFSTNSEGTNSLLGVKAAPALTVADVLFALGIDAKQQARMSQQSDNPHEQTILDLVLLGVSGGEQLLHMSKLNPADFSTALSMLEVQGKVKPLGVNQWGL